MPSYDLRCAACGTGFEVFVTRLLADGDRVCPGCGAHGATTVLTSFVTSRKPRGSTATRVTGFAGRGCCGGACAH